MSLHRDFQGNYQPYEPFTATLKAGTSYDAPWIIVKADSARELQQRLEQLEQEYVLQTVARLSQSLVAVYEHQKCRDR
ncbi:MAG TPA: hypothetical protein VFK47_15535 [Ktedonobacteraceae bacterium]|nr:hypothetical protein [Ktedonobacteraceae bacterium]